jgi:hypothetical protein
MTFNLQHVRARLRRIFRIAVLSRRTHSGVVPVLVTCSAPSWSPHVLYLRFIAA